MIKHKPKVQVGKAKTAPTIEAQAELDAIHDLFQPVTDPTAKAIMRTAQQEADDLFEPPAPTGNLGKGCPCCGTTRGQRAHRDHPVCRGCADAPQRVAERLGVAVGVALRDQHSAAQRATAAYAALDAIERTRYEAYAMLRSRMLAGEELTETERRKLAATSEAYDDRDNDRVSATMRRARVEDECLYWANLSLQGKEFARNTKLAMLGLCLEALGRKDEADALYQR